MTHIETIMEIVIDISRLHTEIKKSDFQFKEQICQYIRDAAGYLQEAKQVLEGDNETPKTLKSPPH